MQRIAGIVFLAFVFALQAEAASGKSNKFRIDELVFLPHPGKLVKLHNDKLQLNTEQKMRIKKEIKAVYVPLFQSKMREAFTLEKKVQRMVAKGHGKAELKELLDAIATLKREAMDSRIDALNRFKKIVTPKQWRQIQRMTYR